MPTSITPSVKLSPEPLPIFRGLVESILLAELVLEAGVLLLLSELELEVGELLLLFALLRCELLLLLEDSSKGMPSSCEELPPPHAEINRLKNAAVILLMTV